MVPKPLASGNAEHLAFLLHPVPPFRLDLTAWAIRRRPGNFIDLWDGTMYQRVLTAGDRPTLVRVTQAGTLDVPRLEVTVFGTQINRQTKSDVTLVLERLLGFRLDLTRFYDLAIKHDRLSALARRFRGVKPPRFPTVWEGIVNGIACQQLSLHVGILLLNRLAATYGARFEERDARGNAFPRPEDIAASTVEDLRAQGFSEAKSRALLQISQAISTGQLDVESFERLDNENAVSKLMTLRGVGRWTAEYALLRGMGRIDLFPGDDIGARGNLKRWLHLRKPLDYDRVARVTDPWRLYRGLIYFHLLLDSIERRGYLDPPVQGDR